MRLLTASTALLLLCVMSQAQEDQLRSRAEATNHEETSRYDVVLRFFDELQKRSLLVRVESFSRVRRLDSDP